MLSFRRRIVWAGLLLMVIDRNFENCYNLETTLIYAHADTELKRKALEQAVPDDSPLKEHLNAARYKVSNEELLKRLCGLK